MKRTVVIIVGEHHSGPAIKKILKNEIVRLKAHGIPVAFCIEGSCDNSIDSYIHDVQQDILLFSDLERLSKYLKKENGITTATMSYVELAEFLNTCKDKRFFKDKDSVVMALNFLVGDSQSYYLSQVCLQYTANLQRLPFYQKLQQLKIPFFGIEGTAIERKKELEESYAMGDTSLIKIETFCCQRMARNAFNAAEAAFKETGCVLFVLAGNAHVRRFGYYFQKLAKENLKQGDLMHFTVIDSVTINHSRGNEFIELYEKDSAAIDTQEMREFYKAHPGNMVDIMHVGDSAFVSPRFTTIVNGMVAKSDHAAKLSSKPEPWYLEEDKENAELKIKADLKANNTVKQHQTVQPNKTQVKLNKKSLAKPQKHTRGLLPQFHLKGKPEAVPKRNSNAPRMNRLAGKKINI